MSLHGNSLVNSKFEFFYNFPCDSSLAGCTVCSMTVMLRCETKLLHLSTVFMHKLIRTVYYEYHIIIQLVNLFPSLSQFVLLFVAVRYFNFNFTNVACTHIHRIVMNVLSISLRYISVQISITLALS